MFAAGCPSCSSDVFVWKDSLGKSLGRSILQRRAGSVSRSDRSQRRYGRVRAATSWVLSIALIFSDRTKGPSDSTGEAQYRLSNSSLFRRLSLSDLEGRSRSASRALRPVLTTAPRIEPFLGTGLPLLARRTTKSLFETRGCYPDDRQSALSCREFSDCFSFYCFDGRLEPTRRRS